MIQRQILATLALLGALALNVRLVYWYLQQRRYVRFLESSLTAARLNQLHDLVTNLGHVAESPITHVTEETPQEKRRHIHHLMAETEMSEPELRDHLLKMGLKLEDVDDDFWKNAEAVVYSMTPEERRHPEIIKGSRRKRIAQGSGATPQEVNRVLNQWKEAKKLAQAAATGRGPNLLNMLRR